MLRASQLASTPIGARHASASIQHCACIPRSRVCSSSSSSSSSSSTTRASSVLIVSDLDGTMIGNDDYTRAFRDFWSSSAKPSGSKLVYSTGRSLASFSDLIAKKSDVMVEPDKLICAVGTKVFERSGDEWIEDDGWSKALGVNWSNIVVVDAAKRAVDECGHENAHLRPADEQNEHKVTVGVKDDYVSIVERSLRDACATSGVDYKIIISGSGGWKFVDCVSAGAGKLESLEYVRKQLGFEHLQTIACGDSGNDILMLSGDTRCIIVGNAESELRKWANDRMANGQLALERVFLATEHEALGILQGLRAFGFA